MDEGVKACSSGGNPKGALGCVATGAALGWQACGGTTYRQARRCSDGTLVYVSMTAANADTLTGSFVLDESVGCLYFNFADATLSSPVGTLHTPADVLDTYPDCWGIHRGCDYFISFDWQVVKAGVTTTGTATGIVRFHDGGGVAYDTFQWDTNTVVGEGSWLNLNNGPLGYVNGLETGSTCIGWTLRITDWCNLNGPVAGGGWIVGTAPRAYDPSTVTWTASTPVTYTESCGGTSVTLTFSSIAVSQIDSGYKAATSGYGTPTISGATSSIPPATSDCAINGSPIGGDDCSARPIPATTSTDVYNCWGIGAAAFGFSAWQIEVVYDSGADTFTVGVRNVISNAITYTTTFANDGTIFTWSQCTGIIHGTVTVPAAGGSGCPGPITITF